MNKKVVILFFPLSESGGGRQIEKQKAMISNIPWALLSLERMIRHLDINVIIIDERFEDNYADIITNYKDNLLFVGVSSLLGRQIEGGIKFTKSLKQITNAPVIWGGWFPTVFPEVLLKDGYADYVCMGQGEIPFKTFTERILAGEDIEDIAGLGYKKNGNVVINKNDKLVNPEIFPKVNIDLIDINRLIDINKIIPDGQRGVDYIATYGCSNSCGFCSVVQVFGSKWYAKKIPDIINDLKYFKERANISHVTFWDENIFANKKFVLEFCHEMINSELSLTWGGFAHIGYFLKKYTDDDIRLIYRAGCRDIRLGAESGDQKTLDMINKKIKVKNTLEVVKLLKKHKIIARIFLMSCFPLNPDNDFWKSLNLMGKALLINPKLYIKIRFFVPIPKTALYQKSIEKGFTPPSTTKEIVEFFNHSFTFDYIAPWTKPHYQRVMNDYVKFYFLFTDLSFFKSFPLKYRFLGFILNILLYPAICFRIKFNFMKFPFEARIFGKLFPYEDYHKLSVKSYMVC